MKTFLITITAMLLMAGTGSVFAQDPGDGPGNNRPEKKRPQHHRDMQATPVLDHLMHALRQLDLSDEQKANTRAILEVMKAEIHPITMEMRAGQQLLKQLIKSPDFDEEAVSALAQKEGDLTAERIMITSLAMSRVMAELTDEQRAELDAMGERRKRAVE
jgi:protein CpxP